MKDRLGTIEQRLDEIEARNKRVELDKKWETSWGRRFAIAIFTYITIGLFMISIKVDEAWINAIIPTISFIISTLSLPLLKNAWRKGDK